MADNAPTRRAVPKKAPKVHANVAKRYRNFGMEGKMDQVIAAIGRQTTALYEIAAQMKNGFKKMAGNAVSISV